MKKLIILLSLCLLLACQEKHNLYDLRVIKQANCCGDAIYKIQRWTIEGYYFTEYWETPDVFTINYPAGYNKEFGIKMTKTIGKYKNKFKTYQGACDTMQIIRAHYNKINEMEKKDCYYTIKEYD